jgi:DHA1 family tetracycline resistance protein-like MFS transporter
MRGLAVLLVAVAIHMIGFGMVIPVMPFLLRELGGDAAARGYLVSLFSLFQLLSAPLWGALADRLGKTRIVASGLLLSALGNAAAYFSNSLFSLAVARAVAGLGGGTIGALQALVAYLSPPERRASSMALFGMAFGAGFVLGPVLGGVAGNIAPRLPSLLATAMSVAAAAVVTRIPVVRGRVQWTFKLELGLLSAAVLLLNFSFSVFEGLVSYYGADVFWMTPSQTGVLMLVVGGRHDGGANGREAAGGQVGVGHSGGRGRSDKPASAWPCWPLGSFRYFTWGPLLPRLARSSPPPTYSP